MVKENTFGMGEKENFYNPDAYDAFIDLIERFKGNADKNNYEKVDVESCTNLIVRIANILNKVTVIDCPKKLQEKVILAVLESLNDDYLYFTKRVGYKYILNIFNEDLPLEYFENKVNSKDKEDEIEIIMGQLPNAKHRFGKIGEGYNRKFLEHVNLILNTALEKKAELDKVRKDREDLRSGIKKIERALDDVENGKFQFKNLITSFFKNQITK